MSASAQRFDRWLRSNFTDINSELEELYFAQDNRAAIPACGADLRKLLHDEGRAHIIELHGEDNAGDGFEAAFELLGNIGLFMGACRRHEISESSDADTSSLIEASALALQIGASLGVAPRFAISHMSTHNRAQNGIYHSFTRLDDERLFLDYNTRGIFAYKRAADALVRTVPLGVTHPVTGDLLRAARRALEDVAASNDRLFEELDSDRFFFSVRPYYRPYRVGQTEYRGANAGDFAGIAEIDLLTGLCQADDPAYAELLADKFPYMMPEDQLRLRDAMHRQSLMDQIIECLDSSESSGAYFEDNVQLFLDVCESHGKTASQHHDQLLQRFIEQPSANLNHKYATHVTANGAPLEVLMADLGKLKDLRIAAPRDDVRSRYRDLERIRAGI